MGQAGAPPHRPRVANGEAAVGVGVGDCGWLRGPLWNSKQQMTQEGLGHQGCGHQALALQTHRPPLNLQEAEATHLP